MKKLMLALFVMCSFAFTSIAQSNDGKKFGKNIIAFNPVHLVASDFVGVGISYEHLVNSYLGIKVPVMVAINNNYFNIGIEAKLYPTKNTGAVRYAIAPMLMVGIGENSYENVYYDMWGNLIKKKIVEPASHFGFLLNQTLNVTISRQFYVGIDGGLGINYYDEKAKFNNNNNTSNLSFVAQLQVGMGYRF